MITQIIIGVLIVVVGVLVVIFSEPIYNFTGSIDAVENKFPGSSRGFIKLIGIILVIAGIVTFTNLWGNILYPIISSFFVRP